MSVWVCICACVHMSVCMFAHDLLVSAQKLEDRQVVCCVCVCVCMCLHMNVRQSSGMRLDGPVGIGIVWD